MSGPMVYHPRYVPVLSGLAKGLAKGWTWKLDPPYAYWTIVKLPAPRTVKWEWSIDE